jgi:hypothetical protein
LCTTGLATSDVRCGDASFDTRVTERDAPTVANCQRAGLRQHNFFVIGYGLSERSSDAFVSIAAAANGVSLMFFRGAALSDPHKLLQGTGKPNRSLKIKSADDLDRSELQALISESVAESPLPLQLKGKPKLIIRSVSGKQRPCLSFPTTRLPGDERMIGQCLSLIASRHSRCCARSGVRRRRTPNAKAALPLSATALLFTDD